MAGSVNSKASTGMHDLCSSWLSETGGENQPPATFLNSVTPPTTTILLSQIFRALAARVSVDLNSQTENCIIDSRGVVVQEPRKRL